MKIDRAAVAALFAAMLAAFPAAAKRRSMARVLRERLRFGKVPLFLDVPNLVEIQKRSFDRFLQKDVPPDGREESGLQSAFLSVFPIMDYNETASIEFLGYIVAEPKFSVRDSLQKGITYAAALKIKVKLNFWEVEQKGSKRLRESREEDVYIGEMPLMTDTGTFIVNGTERVVVSQLHRSPGVFFSHDKGKTYASGRLLYSARVIPASRRAARGRARCWRRAPRSTAVSGKPARRRWRRPRSRSLASRWATSRQRARTSRTCFARRAAW